MDAKILHIYFKCILQHTQWPWYLLYIQIHHCKISHTAVTHCRNYFSLHFTNHALSSFTKPFLLNRVIGPTRLVKCLCVILHAKPTQRAQVKQRNCNAYPSFWLCRRTSDKTWTGCIQVSKAYAYGNSVGAK